MIFSLKNIAFSILCTAIVFLIHFLVPSQTNGFPSNGLNTSFQNVLQNKHAETVFWGRYNNSEFRRRPIVLEFQKNLFLQKNIPFQASFNLINYISLFFLFLLLPYLAYILGGSFNDSVYSQLLLLISMPILFAFLGSICTYDDIVQYLFLVLFLALYFKGSYFLAFIFLLLASISRETSLLFLLLVYYDSYLKHEFSAKFFGAIFLWSTMIIAYFIYLEIYLPQEIISESKVYLAKKRFIHWKHNFGSLRHFRESTTVIFITSAFYLLLIKQKMKIDHWQYWSRFSILLIIINLLIVAVSALIRESRLLFLPLIFIIPFLQTNFKYSLSRIPTTLQKMKLTKLCLILLVGLLVAYVWYTPYTKGTGVIFRLYVFFYVITFFVTLYAQKIKTA